MGKTKERAKARMAVKIKGKGNLPSNRNLVNAGIGYFMASAKIMNKAFAVTIILRIARALANRVANLRPRRRPKPKQRQRERTDQGGDLLAPLLQ